MKKGKQIASSKSLDNAIITTNGCCFLFAGHGNF